MMPHEKERLLALFDRKQRWCQGAEARDAHGAPVAFDDAGATAWDLTGALCLLFGWKRACELFRQLDRHISGQRRGQWHNHRPEIDALVALQDYNDDSQTTYETLLNHLRSMPVWRGPRNGRDDATGPATRPHRESS